MSRLTVQSSSGKYVTALCSCGTVKTFLVLNVSRGLTQSCGCLHKERTQAANRTHGASRTPLYECWKAMKRRCYNPAHQAYRWYGGKGITVCPEWVNNFAQFAADMGGTYSKGLTLDRIDPTLPYSLENCQWLTKSANSTKRPEKCNGT